MVITFLEEEEEVVEEAEVEAVAEEIITEDVVVVEPKTVYVEEEVVNDYVNEFASLSRSSVDIVGDDAFPGLQLHSIEVENE